MENALKDTIAVTSLNAQYDACAKQLLSNKIILAHILKGTVEEFKEMEQADIVPLIEGEPYVSEVPITPGETNQIMKNAGNKITGNNTENVELGEGKVYFDILFYVKMQDGLSQMLVNIEAQKSATPGYHIKNRAIYYTSRMLSSEKERDFVKSNYNDMIKTYSIWICFNLTENCLNRLHMVDTPLLGNYTWDGDTDLMNVVLVGLNEDLTKATLDKTESDLHYLLGTLFSNTLEVAEKIQLLDMRFQMKEDTKIRKGLDEMCNLSYIILEEGIERGIEQGIERGIEQGIERGIEQGIEQGIKRGIEQGIEQGIKESQRNMIREMLLDHQDYALIKKYASVSEEEIRQVEEEMFVK